MSTTTGTPPFKTVEPTAHPQFARAAPRLENGDHLTASEFLRRYEAMPEVKKAELIQGVVYMASPARTDGHANPDHMIQGWLWTYEAATPGVVGSSNPTIRFGADDVPQPDVALRLLPERGGKARINAKGQLAGAPELIVEIAASSAAYDANEKLETYRRFGVAEYILWLTEENRILWMALDDDEYRTLKPDDEGIVRSRVFPGLWMNVNAMLTNDRSAVKTALERGLKSAEHAAFLKS